MDEQESAVVNPFGGIPGYVPVAVAIAFIILWLLAPFEYALWITIVSGVAIVAVGIYVASNTKFT